MSAQERKQNCWQKFFAFFNVQLIKALNSLDSSRSYGRVLENVKTETSTELFLPENDSKASSTVNFPKKHPDFGDLETNQRDEPQARLFFPYALLHMN